MEIAGQIYTIGHSTRYLEIFFFLLREHAIEILADVRSYPGSRRYPQYNKENLSVSLGAEGIKYLHFPDLGGRRKPDPGSHNTAWRNAAFRGYADYMETEAFQKAINRLSETALTSRLCIMCSEAVWWKCHRSMIADYLKNKGWKVLHIMEKGKLQEHPYTSAAGFIQGRLDYGER